MCCMPLGILRVQLRGAAMLNIRIQFAINVKKSLATFGAVIIVLSHLMATPATAAESTNFRKEFTIKEEVVSVSLNYMNVKTTKSEAKKILEGDTRYFDPQTLAFLTVYASGATMAQWKCLNTLWSEESHFNPKALNMSSKALGIAQFLPTTWANYKVTKTLSARLQIKYGLHYIKVRYGTPCTALSFHNKYGWY